MCDDGPALLSAILAHPDEDTPRLMFADWLQSQDNSFNRWLGLFIAQQLSGVPWTENIWPATIVGKATLKIGTYTYGLRLHHAPRQFDNVPIYLMGVPIHSTNGRPDNVFDVNRGFVCGADLKCSNFVKCAGALFARHPIDRIALTNRRPLGITYGTSAPEYDWSWMSAADAQWEFDYWKLPPALFDFIEGHNNSRNIGLGQGLDTSKIKIFSTEKEAGDALARAALLYGRVAAKAWLAAGNTP